MAEIELRPLRLESLGRALAEASGAFDALRERLGGATSEVADAMGSCPERAAVTDVGRALGQAAAGLAADLEAAARLLAETAWAWAQLDGRA